MKDKNEKEMSDEEKLMTKVGSSIFKYGGLFVLIIVILNSFYIINAGERGIVITMGAPSEVPTMEGPHLKVPFFQSIVIMDTKTAMYEATASAASKDLQVVSTKIAVNYHLTQDVVPELYKTIGLDFQTKIIQPAVQEVVKASTAQFTAEELITKRSDVKELIDDGLRKRLMDKGITLETTSITNFDFSDQFNQAIERKVTAEQEALTEKNTLEKIKFQAQQRIAEAEGSAQALIKNAEAQAISLKLQREQVTPELIELRKVEVQSKLADKWTGALPMTVMGSSMTPLLEIPISTNG